MEKLIISNLPEGTTEADIEDLLKGLGYESIDLKPDKYAVVTFEDVWDASRAEGTEKLFLGWSLPPG